MPACPSPVVRAVVLAVLVAAPPRPGAARAEERIDGGFVGNVRDAVVPLEVFAEGGVQRQGTGFLVQVSTQGALHRFLVTARHVLEGTDRRSKPSKLVLIHNLRITAGELRSGHPPARILELPLPGLTPPLVGFPADPRADVAAVYLGQVPAPAPAGAGQTQPPPPVPAPPAAGGSSPAPAPEPERADDSRVLSSLAFLTLPEALGDVDEAETLDQVFFAGFPFGARTDRRLAPLSRSAVIASLATEGYLQHNHGPGSFLIDTGPLPGDSGSPVFLRQTRYAKNGLLQTVRVRLAGVVSHELTYEEQTLTTSRYWSLGEIHKTRLNLGVAFSARLILEAIDAVLSSRSS